MNCKYLKLKLNHKLECKLTNKLVTFNDCKNCINKKYNKTKSSKLAKLERNRTSILTNDLKHCIICGKPKDNLHEIFFGKNRINSIKYKLIIPLCFDCHMKLHNDILMQKEWFIKGQIKFNEVYQDLDFVEIFGKNYL